jgi:hypothetical protein
MTTLPHPCVDIHTTSAPQPSIPPWCAEIVLIAGYLRAHALLEAFGAQVRLVRARFGRYDGYYHTPCVECSNERLGYCGGSCTTVLSFSGAGG